MIKTSKDINSIWYHINAKAQVLMSTMETQRKGMGARAKEGFLKGPSLGKMSEESAIRQMEKGQQ